MVLDRIPACSPYQPQSDAERSRCTLTVDNQPRQIRSVAYGAIEWLNFEDMEGVRPVQAFLFGWIALLVEDNQVGREAGSVEHPAVKLARVVDAIVLRNPREDLVELGPRQDAEGGICGLYQRLVECGLRRSRGVAEAAVVPVVSFEVRVRFDRFDGRFPSGLPVVRDAQDMLHEDPKVNKYATLEVLPNVVLIVVAGVPIDPVRIAFLPLSDRRPVGEGSDIRHGTGGVVLALWRLDFGLGRGRRRRMDLIRFD